eukprot:1321822-Amorphochlora_amoeboformis.AAC.1
MVSPLFSSLTILNLSLSFFTVRERGDINLREPWVDSYSLLLITGEVRLLLKGADSAVFERLKPPGRVWSG